jgi:hypothetical protein
MDQFNNETNWRTIPTNALTMFAHSRHKSQPDKLSSLVDIIVVVVVCGSSSFEPFSSSFTSLMQSLQYSIISRQGADVDNVRHYLDLATVT